MWRRRVGMLLLAPVGLIAVACGTDEGTSTLSVASSLTDVAEAWADGFEAAGGGLVEVNAAGSPTVVAQVIEGAPVDVLVTADAGSMDRAVAAGVTTGTPTVIARNTAVLVARAGSGIEDFGDLTDPEVALAMCAPEVPCGAAGVELLEQAGVAVDPVTEEASVRSVLTKVELGEVDAGIVYRTDALAADGPLVTVELGRIEATGPDARERPGATYLAATVSDEPAATDLLAFIAGPEGQALLADAGFLAP